MKIPPGWQAPLYPPPGVARNRENGKAWLVSAVVLNWNAASHTLKCLESLSRQTYPGSRLEVIVIDNGSRESIALVQRALEQHRKEKGWKRAEIVCLPSNIGIPAGYNVGLRHISVNGDAFLRLDNDVVLDSRFIELAAKTMAQSPDIAALGGFQRKENGEVTGLPYSVNWKKGGEILPFTPDPRDQLIDCDTIPGCALMIRRDAIRGMQVVFDSQLWVLHDETDLLIRLQRAGWRICYLPTAQCIHEGGISTNRMPEFFRYVTVRNLTLLKRRYAPFLYRMRIYSFLVRTLLRSMSGQDRIFTRALRDGLIGNPWKPRITKPLPQRPELEFG